MYNPNSTIDANSSNVSTWVWNLSNRGATHGIQPSDSVNPGDLTCLEQCGGQGATPGSLDFVDKMFSWRFTTLQAICYKQVI